MPRRRILTLGSLLAGGFLLAGLAAPARAAESAPVTSARLTATLVSDTDHVAARTPFHVGLRLQMAPGWHTYWRNPGDAGVPPELDLTLPEGAAAGPIAWPAPERLSEGGVMTYAYTGEVLLPVTVTPAAASGAITAHATWLVCEKICVPEEGDFRLDLPAGPPSPSPQAPLFAAAGQRMPRPSPFAASFAPDGTLSVSGAGLDPASVAQAYFLPAANGAIDDSAPQRMAVHQGGFTLALKPGPNFDAGAPLEGILQIRDRGGEQADLWQSVQAGGAPALASSPSALPLGRIVALALLGGLILNLMPCVFPVLAMKALGIARLSGERRFVVRTHALSYTAGVVLAFVALGAALLMARTAGSAAGWGFQFQSPIFVAGIAWLLFAVGLNLSGVFEIGFGGAGAGQGVAARGGHLGSFATGLLAVVVATPCTAPFMGAAIAAGLAAPAAVTMLVFAAMGVGLAAPYLLLALVPALARLMPKPGRWMDIFKQALAFPMYAAAAWLVWVLSQQTGPTGVLTCLVGIVLLGFAGWALGVAQASAGVKGRRVGRSAAIAGLLAALAVLSGVPVAPTEGTVAEAGVEAFSPARLAALRAQGKPVFIDMTAAWCVTCLVNERVAITTAPMQQEFARRGIVYLKGDWTRQDPEITAFLRAHGRDGVPLYVYYPADGREPVVLPQILTEGLLLGEIDQAGT
jgi:thiol:disulfide interchange protein DsbD